MKVAAPSHFRSMLARYANGDVIEDRNGQFTYTNRLQKTGYLTALIGSMLSALFMPAASSMADVAALTDARTGSVFNRA